MNYIDKIIFTFIIVSLWISNYSAVCNHTVAPLKWQLITLLPGILSTIIYIFAVRSAVLLKAATSLDADILELTLEDVSKNQHVKILFVVIIIVENLFC